MKKLIIFLIVICCFGQSFGQFTSTHNYSSASTLENAYGGLRANVGLITVVFSDTSSANLTPIKGYGGAMIMVGTSDFYIRNYTHNQWVKVNGGAGSIGWQDVLSYNSNLSQNNVCNLNQKLFFLTNASNISLITPNPSLTFSSTLGLDSSQAELSNRNTSINLSDSIARLIGYLKLNNYFNTDTNKVLSTDGSGNLVFRTKGNSGSSNSWLLTGNDSTAGKFIGTLDGNPFRITVGTDTLLKLESNDKLNIGNYAGSTQTGYDAVNIGPSAGYLQSGNHTINIGANSGGGQTGSNVINIGANSGAGFNQTGNGVINIGDGAGAIQGGGDVIIMGTESGNGQTGNGAIILGLHAGSSNIGDSIILIGVNANSNRDSVCSNSVAIGANAYVSKSNSMVLGSIAGVNSATADTKVGIGTITPTAILHTVGTVRHEGLIEGSPTDSALTIDAAGNVHKRVMGGGSIDTTYFAGINLANNFTQQQVFNSAIHPLILGDGGADYTGLLGEGNFSIATFNYADSIFNLMDSKITYKYSTNELTLNGNVFMQEVGSGNSADSILTIGTSNKLGRVTKASLQTDTTGIRARLTAGLGINITGTYPSLTIKVDTADASIISRQRAAATYTLISDTSLFARKQMTAYSMRVNNTASPANSTYDNYRNFASASFTDSVTYNGTPPSGGQNYTYRWLQQGNLVTLNISLVNTSNGSGITSLTVKMPSGIPTPAAPAGLTAASMPLYPCNVDFLNAALSNLSVAQRTVLRRNASNDGYEIVSTMSTAAPAISLITVQYFTN